MDRFGELGLIDDHAFASRWVESRRGRRGLSRQALQRELANKGVDWDVVQDATAGIAQDEEFATACELARRKIRTLHGLPPAVRARRLAGFLGRRGFDGSVVAQVLRAVAAHSPDDEL